MLMATTYKRVSLFLTQEDYRQLEALKLLFGENNNQVFKRALIMLHHLSFTIDNDRTK